MKTLKLLFLVIVTSAVTATAQQLNNYIPPTAVGTQNLLQTVNLNDTTIREWINNDGNGHSSYMATKRQLITYAAATFTQTRTAYVDTLGNNSTAILGRPDKPFATVLAAMTAGGNLINVGIGRFVVDSLVFSRNDIHIVGAGVPFLDTVGTDRLIGGTILRGTIDFNSKKGAWLINLGVETTSTVYIDAVNAGNANLTIPLYQGLQNVVLLGRGSANGSIHAWRGESGTWANISNILLSGWIHGIAIKTSNTNVTNIQVRKVASHAVVVKADGFHPLVENVNISQVIGTAIDVGTDNPNFDIESNTGTIVRNINLTNISTSKVRYQGLQINYQGGTLDNVHISNATIMNSGGDGVSINGGSNITFDGIAVTKAGVISGGYSFNSSGSPTNIYISNSTSSIPTTGDITGTWTKTEINGVNNTVTIASTPNATNYNKIIGRNNSGVLEWGAIFGGSASNIPFRIGANNSTGTGALNRYLGFAENNGLAVFEVGNTSVVNVYRKGGSLTSSSAYQLFDEKEVTIAQSGSASADITRISAIITSQGSGPVNFYNIGTRTSVGGTFTSVSSLSLAGVFSTTEGLFTSGNSKGINLLNSATSTNSGVLYFSQSSGPTFNMYSNNGVFKINSSSTNNYGINSGAVSDLTLSATGDLTAFGSLTNSGAFSTAGGAFTINSGGNVAATYTTSAATSAFNFTSTFNSSGTSQVITPLKNTITYNQSSATSAKNSDIFSNRIETNLGATPASQYLIELQRGGTLQFGADRLGNIITLNTATGTAGTDSLLVKEDATNQIKKIAANYYMSNPMTTAGDGIYGGVSGMPTRYAGNTTATTKFLTQVSGGAPTWVDLLGGNNTFAGVNTFNNGIKLNQSTGVNWNDGTYTIQLKPASSSFTSNMGYDLPMKSGYIQALDVTGAGAPSSSSDTGIKGEVRIPGDGFRYECIATNTWIRIVVFSTF